MLGIILDLNTITNVHIEKQQIQTSLGTQWSLLWHTTNVLLHFLSCHVNLSTSAWAWTKAKRVSKLIQLLMWLSLVSIEHLGSNANDIRKHIIEKNRLNREKMLIGKARKQTNISKVKIYNCGNHVILLVNVGSPTKYSFILNFYWISLLVTM